jgi:UDP-N-acetylglucosamine--N-acetylmuramyl-(pentapeptide) pyrophosphoryl-undecaprenol N-acetylglucosamine transferase
MNKKICFFCVGTGGHVLPVKNLVIKLLDLGVKPDDIIVVTDDRGKQYLKNLDINLNTIQIFVSNYGVIGYVLNLIKIIRTLFNVIKLLKNKNIGVVLTTGAYIAPIASIISVLYRAKFYIQEQNIYAGLGNKVSALFADKVFTSFEGTQNIKYKKIDYTGPIVNTTLNRSDIQRSQNRSIGFMGGSQGSDEINTYVNKFVKSDDNLDLNIIHITGKNKDNLIIESQNYQSIEFVNNMDDFYKEIDVLVGRAGGGSLEAAYLGIPQVLVPYKHGTTSSHQEFNAQYLEKMNFGFVAKNYDDLENFIKETIFKLKNNKLEIPNLPIGNEVIAKELYEQIN